MQLFFIVSSVYATDGDLVSKIISAKGLWQLDPAVSLMLVLEPSLIVEILEQLV